VIPPARVVVACLVALAGCARALPPNVVEIDRAERLLVSSSAPPAADAPGWTTVSLPDWWGVAVRRSHLEGWFRARLRLREAPREVWAVHLPRIGQSAGVWVNGELIGTSGGFTEPLPRNWNRSQLFPVPASILRVGENDILIRLVTHRGAPGFLRGFFVGPVRLLQPLHDARVWRQETLGQIIGTASLAGGLLLLVFSFRDDRFRAQRLLALGLVLWAWTSADAFVKTIPVPSRWWEASTAAALVWCLVCFVFGFHRMLERKRPRVETAILAVAGAYTAALLLAPRLYAFTLVVVGGGIAVLMAVYLIAMLMRASDAAPGRGRALMAPAVVGVLFGVHDLIVVTIGHAALGMLLSPYIPVVAMAAAGWMLLDRHLASVSEIESLNADLEARVESKHRELEDNYARLRTFERDRAVMDERERIMQDVHDGMGGQLVSTLAMVESGEFSADEVGDALRGALDDLRLVIDSLDPDERDLLSVLGMVRSRLEPRLARHGLTFRWQVADASAMPTFGPEEALQVMRIVQEAITNVLKHAGAATITVRTGEATGPSSEPGVLVEIEDDGVGIDVAASPGRGLAGMRRRAERLGGVLVVEPTGSGTRLRLWLPTAFDA